MSERSSWKRSGRRASGGDMRRTREASTSSSYGAASPVTPKFISPSDPAAQWTGAMKSAAFFAYADNYLIDVKFGIIMDVEASRAIRQAELMSGCPHCACTPPCSGPILSLRGQ